MESGTSFPFLFFDYTNIRMTVFIVITQFTSVASANFNYFLFLLKKQHK